MNLYLMIRFYLLIKNLLGFQDYFDMLSNNCCCGKYFSLAFTLGLFHHLNLRIMKSISFPVGFEINLPLCFLNLLIILHFLEISPVNQLNYLLLFNYLGFEYFFSHQDVHFFILFNCSFYFILLNIKNSEILTLIILHFCIN